MNHKLRHPDEPNFFIRLIGTWGDVWLRIFEFIGGITGLLVDVLEWFLKSLTRKDVRFGRAALVAEIVRIGTRSVGITQFGF